MNKTFRRTLVASTMAVALGATMATTSAVAEQARPGSAKAAQLSNFGYKGTAVGAKLYVNNVQLLSTKDAVAPLRCTRKVGRSAEATSVLSAPENSLIALSGSTSRTVTYRDGSRYGVKAINTLGDITLGGTLPGQEESTPIVTLKGLQTVADSFHTPAGYDHEETFSAPELVIDISVLEDAGVPIPPELTDLLDTLTETGGELSGQVIDLLEQVGAPIDIPELGSIGLGKTKGSKSGHHAESQSTALEFVITATGEVQKLQLGNARSRIGGPTPGGVFRSTSMPLDVKALDGAVHFGGVKPRTIPCEGTNGKTRTRTLDSASVALPEGLLVGATGMEYVFSGTQHKNGTAEGFNASRIGAVDIPALDLQITGIASKVSSRTTSPGGKVKSTPTFKVAKIVYQGNEIAVPEPGEESIVEGLGVLETRVVEATKWGKRVTALRVSLTDYGVVMDLGISASQIFAY